MARPKKFEYLAVQNKDIETLNQYGRMGWELVSVIFKFWGTFSNVAFYFKREINGKE